MNLVDVYINSENEVVLIYRKRIYDMMFEKYIEEEVSEILSMEQAEDLRQYLNEIL